MKKIFAGWTTIGIVCAVICLTAGIIFGLNAAQSPTIGATEFQ